EGTSGEPAAVEERLKSWLPALPERTPGAPLGYALGRVALTLQRLAGAEAFFCQARETSQPGVSRVACGHEEEGLGSAALAAARELCLAAVRGLPFDAEAEVARLRDLAGGLRPAPLAGAVARAARRRGVPVQELGEGLLLLGQGARQRRVLGA